MQTVYLKDGTQANLIAKTDNGYVVDPLEIYHDFGTKEEYTEPSGKVMMVDKVYEKAPIEVIEAEYKDVLNKVEAQEKLLAEKRDELRKAEFEISRIKNTKTDLNRYIINREELRNAKRLIVFKQHSLVPTILDGTKSVKFSINYEISQYKGEEKCWAYTIYSENRDYGWSSGDYFDPEYGILIDLTDEEIKKISLERLSKKPKDYFNENAILATSEEWLTPEYIEIKKSKRAKHDAAELENAQKELKYAQDKIDKLMQKEMVAS